MEPEFQPWAAWAQTQGVWCLLFLGTLWLLYFGIRKAWKLFMGGLVPYAKSQWEDVKESHKTGMAKITDALGGVSHGVAEIHKKLDPLPDIHRRVKVLTEDDDEPPSRQDRRPTREEPSPRR